MAQIWEYASNGGPSLNSFQFQTALRLVSLAQVRSLLSALAGLAGWALTSSPCIADVLPASIVLHPLHQNKESSRACGSSAADCSGHLPAVPPPGMRPDSQAVLPPPHLPPPQ